MSGNTVCLTDLVPPAYRKIWKSHCMYKVLKGSKGSGKSKFAALWHIYNIMTHPQANVLVIRKVFGTCRDSVYTDLLWAIDRLGVLDYWDYIQTNRTDDPFPWSRRPSQIGVHHCEDGDPMLGLGRGGFRDNGL